MEEKLKDIVLRFDDLQAQLGDPAVYSDAERLRKVNRELKELTPVAEASSAYFQARKEASEAEALLSDPDFRELAREELERHYQKKVFLQCFVKVKRDWENNSALLDRLGFITD